MADADPRLLWTLANRASKQAIVLDSIGAPATAGLLREAAARHRAAASACLAGTRK